MAQPIQVLSLQKVKAAWYEQSEEERKAKQVKVEQAIIESGMKRIAICDTSWSSEWDFYALSEFPSIEAYQKLQQRMWELEYNRDFETRAILGTDMLSRYQELEHLKPLHK